MLSLGKQLNLIPWFICLKMEHLPEVDVSYWQVYFVFIYIYIFIFSFFKNFILFLNFTKLY